MRKLKLLPNLKMTKQRPEAIPAFFILTRIYNRGASYK